MVVFSITFTITAISVVGKTTGWKDLALDYQKEQQLVETNMRAAAASHAAEKAVWVDAKNDLNLQITSLEKQLQTAQAENATLKDDVARLEAHKDNADALSRMLAARLKLAQENWSRDVDELKEIDNRNSDLTKRNADLNERVNEQNATIVVMVQEKRHLEQQINILREENTKLARAGMPGAATKVSSVGLDNVTPVASTTGAPVRGRVVEVQGKILTLSVGSSDGVQEGMVFVIHRGTQYVGDVEITDVEPNLAAGRIIRSQVTPLPNDQVADEASL